MLAWRGEAVRGFDWIFEIGRFARTVALAIVFVAGPPVEGRASGGTTADADKLIEQFLRQTTTGFSGRSYVVRWEKPVRVQVIGEPSAVYRDLFPAQLRRLAALTGLDVRDAGPGEKANLTVMFVASPARDPFEAHRAETLRIFGSASEIDRFFVFGPWGFTGDSCYATRRFAAKNREVTNALAVFPLDSDAREARACVLLNLLETFGLRGGMTPGSYLNAADPQPDLTAQDELFLAALYDSRLKAGLGREAALPVVRAVLAETKSKRAVAPPLSPLLESPNDELAERFVRQIMAEYGSRAVVSKWRDPVRFELLGERAEDYREGLTVQSAHLRRVSGHDITVVPPGERGNILVLFAADIVGDPFGKYRDELLKLYQDEKIVAVLEKTRKARRRPECYFHFGKVEQGFPTRGLVVMPAYANPIATHMCLIEETAQVLGLANDGVPGSVFHDKRNRHNYEMTEQDELFLRVLYDPRLRAGISFERAAIVARRIIGDLRSSGRAEMKR